MNKQHTFWLVLIAAGLLLLGAGLAGCAPDTSAPELGTEVAQLSEPGDGGQAIPAADDTETGDAVVAVAFTDFACLDCHTDQARVQELAVEEEEDAESLSSGPG